MNLIDWCKSNGYYLKNQIDFDYDRYGDGNISVTTILKLIEDPSFNYVLVNNRQAIEKACIEGTKIHKEAEDFHTKGSGVKTMNKNFVIFHSLYGIKSIYQEKTYLKDGVRGTIDCVGQNNLGVYYNIDYKNSKIHSKKYCLQLGGYKYLNGYDGILVYGKGRLNVVEVDSYYESLFIELKNYFFNLLKIKICEQKKR